MAPTSTCVDSAVNLLPGLPPYKNFTFLRTFLCYIPRLIEVDDDLPQHLGDTVAEIESAFENSSDVIEKASFEGKESLNAVSRNLMEKFDFFKPKIMQVYDYLSDHKVQGHCSIDFDTWRRFLHDIISNMETLKFPLNSSLGVHISALSKKLHSIRIWLQYSVGSDYYCKFTDLCIHFGSVAISAARLSFYCWVEKENIPTDMNLKMAADLRRMIWCSTPEVLELYLTAMKSIERYSIGYIAENFVEFQLPMGVYMTSYREGLTFLVIFLTKTSAEKAGEVDVELISTDIKSALMEMATVEFFAREREDYPSNLQFPEKIELLKAEVFLTELLNSSKKGKTTIDTKITFESLNKGLKSLQKFRKRHNPSEQDRGKLEQLLNDFKMVVADVESLCQSNSSRVGEDGEKDLLKQLLHIKLLKTEVFLMELFKDQGENRALQVLRKSFCCSAEEKLMYGTRFLSRIEELARKASCLHHSLFLRKETEDMVVERNDLLSKFLKEIEDIRREIEDSLGQVGRSSQFSFPKTNGAGFVDYFLEMLNRLVELEAFPTDYVKHQIQLVLQELESMRSFVNDAVGTDHYTRIVNLAYEADYVIDSILLQNGSACYHMAWLSDVIQELKSINKQIKEFADIEAETVAEIEEIREFNEKTPKFDTPNIDGLVILVRENEEKFIKDQVQRTTKSREIITIVGTGGIGKTTLAKKIFHDEDVQGEFQIRAWGYVTENYEKRRLLLEIFNSVIKETDQVEKMKDEEIEDLLKKRLSGKKYLIVLDDLWDTRAWDDLALSFPKQDTGSRILITSRERKVASKIKGSDDHFDVPQLDEAQRWSLLEKKVFQGKEYYPLELIQLGKSIAKDCDGLPLAIVVIADLLNQEKTDRWKEIAKDVSTAAAEKTEILEVSYKHLPDTLKPCFLYLGNFQRDKEIVTRKLLKLWIAEGFVKNNDPNVSAEYLNGLINRSLIIATKETSQGGAKAIKIHNVLHNLCRSKAETEYFLKPITGYGEHFGGAYDLFKSGDIPKYVRPLNPIKYETHRLSIHSRRNHFAMLKPSGSPVRSLLFFGTEEEEEDPRCTYNMAFISENFKLLRVLDLESINVRSIVLLKRLRYLAISGNIESIPESIADLWNLETFFVKGLTGTVHIPETIWGMKSLKQFHVGNTAIFSFQKKPEKSSNLLSFSTPYISCEEDTEKLMKILSKVQKLRCKFSKSQGHSCSCNKGSSVFCFLTQVESLNVSYYGGIPQHCEFWFPSTLTKLSLSNLDLQKSYISKIASLSELKVLKLLWVSFDGLSWEVVDEFPKLEYLKIDSSRINSWEIADTDLLPELRRLVLGSCNQLQRLPECFSEIDSLQMIELQRCGQSVKDSALEIQKEKMSNSQTFKLFIDGQLR